ncbi:hypothetical protein [Mucilaginibacter sp. CSA2-8R]|uniref:hypothetical protein n=1 Tax=Mucilaginibacter sp. CSA2-8R TaxID=3141542 RepID=UPI00315D9EE4
MMKYNEVPKQALVCLIIGLLLVCFTPINNKHLAMPDYAKGFLSGLGITLEFIALVKIQRSRKESQRCNMLSMFKKIS